MTFTHASAQIHFHLLAFSTAGIFEDIKNDKKGVKVFSWKKGLKVDLGIENVQNEWSKMHFLGLITIRWLPSDY